MVPDIVFYLLKKGCHAEPRRITTGEIASQIGVSQQTASRKFIKLEKNGFIRRVDGKVLVTDRAIKEVRHFMNEILSSLDGTSIIFEGSVVQGLGEGAYYLSQQGYVSQFGKLLGFKPFPGTLNISLNSEEIEKRLVLRQKKPIEIPGFKKSGRTFGKIEAYRCAILGLPCAIVFPERSVHGLQVLEIISHFNLRKKLGLKDGSRIRVEVV
jgi:riboflavin kinase